MWFLNDVILLHLTSDLHQRRGQIIVTRSIPEPEIIFLCVVNVVIGAERNVYHVRRLESVLGDTFKFSEFTYTRIIELSIKHFLRNEPRNKIPDVCS